MGDDVSAVGARGVGGTSGFQSAVRMGATLGVVVALVVLGLGAYLHVNGKRMRFESHRDVSRVLVILALPDEGCHVVAQVVAEVDLAGRHVTSVDPSMSVTIPGTSYSALRDAYPFGGGAAVAQALARARGGEVRPYLVLTREEVQRWLSASSGVDVLVPEAMAVFDGEQLYEWDPGVARISTMSELCAILNGAGYLGADARERVLEWVAEGAVSWIGSNADKIGGVAGGTVETDLTTEVLRVVASRMLETVDARQ